MTSNNDSYTLSDSQKKDSNVKLLKLLKYQDHQ